VREHGYSSFLTPGSLRYSSYNHWIKGQLVSADARDLKFIFIFIDGFGTVFFDKFKRASPLIRRFLSGGSVEEAVSQFPSTTACHLTTIHFAQPVGSTGIFEWNYYEPLADGIISPLLFSRAGDKERETLRSEGFEGRNLFPFMTFYEHLRVAGVPSYVFQSSDYCPSSFSDSAFRGSTVITHKTQLEGIANLAKQVEQHDGRGYFFIYLDGFDAAGHKFGPHSVEASRALLRILEQIETHLVRQLSGEKGVRLMISADHGQVEVSPDRTVYIDKEIPESLSWLRCNSRGEPLVAGGSARDFFLYIKPEFMTTALDILSDRLSKVAYVRTVESLIAEGYFGEVSGITQRLRDRLSELVILPFPDQSVWWSGDGRFEKNFLGNHGGLAPDEVQIPRLVMDL